MSWRLRDQPPTRRRVVRTAVAYAVVMLLLVALDLSPSPVLVAGFFVTGVSIAAFFADRFLDNRGDPWVAGTPSTAGLGRGADHRTDALARRLAHRERDPNQRRALATDLHGQLRAVLVDQVRRERGWDVVADPALAYEALAADLADLVVRPPDLRLVDPVHLSALLDRIESR